MNEFPNLTNQNHSITSEATDEYNCIAWAYGLNDKWMWPGNPDSYWPSGILDRDELNALIELFLNIGYEECESSELEEGFQKVAIYMKDNKPTHAALQLESGSWTSKLGEDYDIEHDTLENLENGIYGKATRFFKKSRKGSN